jgi:hypothetical protein
MDRYQIAIGVPKSNVLAYVFKPSRSAKKVLSFMRRCVQDEKEFLALDIDMATLNMAMVLLSREVDVPILVNTESEAQSLSMAYSHKRVYHKGNFPALDSYAIFHPEVDRNTIKDIKPLLLIRRIGGRQIRISER